MIKWRKNCCRWLFAGCGESSWVGPLWGALALIAAALPVQAGGGPENVAVIVNADSWASQMVANHYVQWRQIPPSNVVYIEGLNSFERTDIETLREKILIPVFTTLHERDLLNSIDYIVYSSDFPTAIDATRDLGGAKPKPYLSATGSITGLTYLYQLVLSKNPLYINLLTNFYGRRPLREVELPQLSAADRQAVEEILQRVRDKKWNEAVKAATALTERLPNHPLLLYNLACALAGTGQSDAAIKALEQAVNAGWTDAEHTRSDADLEPLRALPAFDVVLKNMEARQQEVIDVQPTIGFRSSYQWDQNGARTSSNGVRYVLSTMLAVTSGRGNSVREALDYLERSVQADATHPTGTVYFADNEQEIRSRTRKWAFESAVQALQGTGVQGAIIQTTLPEQKDDVLGAMIGSASVNWRKAGSTILPGAICEHLTSFGGMMAEGSGQTPLSEFLRYGAAGSSGTVVEPMAIQAKFPNAFMHVHYARGASLAEAFYQSLFGPYQLLVVGDALCQPWATRLKIEVPGVEPGQRVTGQLAIEPRVADGGESKAVDHFEIFVDGQRLPTDPAGPRHSWDTTVFGDGWHELRVVAVGADPLETRSRVILPVMVDNHGGSLNLVRDQSADQDVVYGQPLVVRATAPSAQSVAVVHNGRTLGVIERAEGTASIDTRKLGLGPVALQAMARMATRECFSAPLHVTVVPPPALEPVTGVDAKKLVDGLTLTVDGGKPVVVTDTHKDAQWLAKLVSAEGKSIELDAYFTAPATDLYQFQFEGNSVSTIQVDGQPIWPIEGTSQEPVGWTMVPVHLQKGLHRFQLLGTTPRTPALRVRFGGAGCTSLDGKRFRHVSEP